MEVNMTAFRMGNALRAYLAGRGAQREDEWEVLFDGSVTHEKEYTSDGQTYYWANLDALARSDGGIGRARITIDGVSRVYSVEWNPKASFGNPWLAMEGEDDGFDAFISMNRVLGTVYFRTGGSHALKIERVLDKKLVAYLYNGVRLPVLPVASFKYLRSGLIHTIPGREMYYLVEVDNVRTGTDASSGESKLAADVSRNWSAIEGGAEWTNFTEYDPPTTQLIYTPIWADSNVINRTNRELVIEGSDPIPVYE